MLLDLKIHYNKGMFVHLTYHVHCLIKSVLWYENLGSYEGNEVAGFLRIFTVAFLLFLTPAGGSNPAGLIL